MWLVSQPLPCICLSATLLHAGNLNLDLQRLRRLRGSIPGWLVYRSRRGLQKSKSTSRDYGHPMDLKAKAWLAAKHFAIASLGRHIRHVGIHPSNSWVAFCTLTSEAYEQPFT